MIEHSKVKFDDEVIQAVCEVLKSGWILEGKKTNDFENNLCNYIGRKYGMAITSGTLGIIIALKSLGVKKGDKVATSTYICRSVIDAIKCVGAEPFLCDINLEDYSIDYEFLKENFDSDIKCIIIPHMFGLPTDIIKFRNFELPIIEDCAQSLGSEYKKYKCGSFGDISVFSFQATKMITTGEGGMLLTNNDKLYDKIQYFKTGADLTEDFAYNFNYTDIQSAIGIEQLKRIDSYIGMRKGIYNRYYENLELIEDIILQGDLHGRQGNYFKFIVKLKNEKMKNDIISNALKCGIKIKMPIAPMPIHSMMNLNKCRFKNADEIFNKAISIPIYHQLSNNEINKIIDFMKNYFDK
jgi:perosamine synthetase